MYAIILRNLWEKITHFQMLRIMSEYLFITFLLVFLCLSFNHFYTYFLNFRSRFIILINYQFLYILVEFYHLFLL
jgi:hypothetical protein